MRILLLIPLLTSCQMLPNIDDLGFVRLPPVDDKKEFWKVPCIWDGKVLDNINEDLKPKDE